MPKSANELINDQNLLISLIKANGSPNVQSVVLGDKMQGTVHHVQRATLDCGDSKIDVVIKYNAGGSPDALASCPWREAYFYSKIAHQIPSFKTPKVYLALADKEQGQQFLVTEFLEESINVRDISTATFM